MAQRVRNCLEAMQQLAKAGKMRGRYPIYSDQVKLLEREGFSVTLPNSHSDFSKKNSLNAIISWECPTVDGVAKRFNKLVVKYRQNCNTARRTSKIRANARRSDMNVNWLLSDANPEECDDDIEFFDELVDDYYGDDEIY